MTTLSDALPKWLQVTAALESEIDKRLAEGVLRLPTEAELCEIYAVSLVTVRQALGALEKRGLISRNRKRGTFITPEGFVKPVPISIGKISDLIDPPISERAELIFAEVVPVPTALADRLSDQVNIMKLIQRHFVGDQPSCYQVDHVRLDIAGQTDLSLLKTSSIWHLLEHQSKVTIGHIDQRLTAKCAWPEIADNLGVELLSPVMVLSTECLDQDGEILSLSTQTYRGDLFEFQLTADAA